MFAYFNAFPVCVVRSGVCRFFSLNEYTYIMMMVQDLFRKVVPQQCLGSVWSRRSSGSSRQNGGRAGGHSPASCVSDETVASVSATVDQFNAVTHRVIASIVDNSQPTSSLSTSLSSAPAAATMSLPQRARVIEKWIDVAQVNPVQWPIQKRELITGVCGRAPSRVQDEAPSQRLRGKALP